MALRHRLWQGLFAIALLVGAVVRAQGDEREPARLTGRVVDGARRPIEGADVHLGLYTLGNMTKTDRDGRFAFDVAHSDVAPLTVWRNGYRERRLELPADTQDAEITLDRGVVVAGRLAMPEGVGLPATVTVLSEGDCDRRCVALVREDGAFEASGFAPETRQRRVGVLVSRCSSHTILTAVDGARVDLGTITVVPSRGLTVRVVAPGGDPLEDVRVRVENARWSALLWGGVSDADGVARFAEVDRADLVVTARREGARAPTFTSLALWSDDASSELEVVVKPDRPLTGMFAWEGHGPSPWTGEQPIDVLVQAFEGDVQRHTWFGQTDGRGSARFCVYRTVPGTWRLKISVALTSSIWVDVPEVEIPLGTAAYDIGRVTLRGQ